MILSKRNKGLKRQGGEEMLLNRIKYIIMMLLATVLLFNIGCEDKTVEPITNNHKDYMDRALKNISISKDININQIGAVHNYALRRYDKLMKMHNNKKMDFEDFKTLSYKAINDAFIHFGICDSITSDYYNILLQIMSWMKDKGIIEKNGKLSKNALSIMYEEGVISEKNFNRYSEYIRNRAAELKYRDMNNSNIFLFNDIDELTMTESLLYNIADSSLSYWYVREIGDTIPPEFWDIFVQKLTGYVSSDTFFGALGSYFCGAFGLAFPPSFLISSGLSILGSALVEWSASEVEDGYLPDYPPFFP